MDKTSLRKRRLRAGIGLIGGAFAVLATVAVWPRERLLTEVARPVMNVQSAKQTLYWLSDHRLLHIATDEFGAFVRRPQGRPIWQNWNGSADLIDPVAKTTTQLPALTDLLKRTTEFPARAPDDFAASPDGEWVLWYTYIQEHSRPSSHVARLDGTYYRKLSRTEPDDSFFSDSHRLVQITMVEPAMIVYDLKDPSQDRKYEKSVDARTALAHYALHNLFSSYVTSSDKNERHGYVEIDTYRTADKVERNIVWPYSERYVQKPVRAHTLELPRGATFEGGVVSQQQQSIVYHLQISHTSPLLTWLHRLFPKYDSGPTLTESLWVSRSDGQGMHEIGHVPAGLDANGTPHDLLKEIRWLPNGKQISLVLI